MSAYCRQCEAPLPEGCDGDAPEIDPARGSLVYRDGAGRIVHQHLAPEEARRRRSGSKGTTESEALSAAVWQAMTSDDPSALDVALRAVVQNLAAVATSGKTHSVNALKLLAAWSGKPATEVPKPAEGEPCPLCGRLGDYPVIVDVGADIRALADDKDIH